MNLVAGRFENRQAGYLLAMAIYVAAHRFRNRAACDCGWWGKQRLLRGSAIADVFIHCAHHCSEDSAAEPDLVDSENPQVLILQAS